MATLSLYLFDSTCLPHYHHPFAIRSSLQPSSIASHSFPDIDNVGSKIKARRRSTSRFVALSTHSNPRILKSNRKSRYGQALSPYDSEEDEHEGNEDDDSEEDWLSDVSFFPLSFNFSSFCFILPFSDIIVQ